MDLVARADGVLRQVAVAEGQTVPVGSVVAVIAAPGETVGATAASAPPPAPVPSGSGMRDTGYGMRDAGRVVPAPTDVTRVKASPLAKRMAREAGVDLKLVTGSGPGGRVVKRDLEGTAQGAPTPVAAVADTHPASRIPHPASPRISHPAVSGVPFEDIPLTQIRKTIAKRLVTSLGPIPHFFLTSEVDMERAAEAREALNKQLGDRGKVSFNDIVIKATGLALIKHRACNAWFQEDHIRYWNEVHIGMAVAVEDGRITPVIRNAAVKSLAEIGRGATAVAEQARSRGFRPGRYRGRRSSSWNWGCSESTSSPPCSIPPRPGTSPPDSSVRNPLGGVGEVTGG